jgi:hypothetical protein
MTRALTLVGLSLLLGLFLVGCSSNDQTPPPKKDNPAQTSSPAKDTKPEGTEHTHKPGQHGGILVSIGTDSYHAEAVFEKGGILRLYMLGKDESRIQEVDRQTLEAYIKVVGDTEATQFVLQSDPTYDDVRERTSRFKGTIPPAMVGKALEVTITNLRINGERFRLSFRSVADPGEHGSMPPPSEDERALYLTPGGKYTAQDVEANGNTSARAKYQGIKTEHDDHPAPGEKICPISKTKSNPKITWIVGGKVYEFCCPPCVDEFVNRAKEKPEMIQEPASYRQP